MNLTTMLPLLLLSGGKMSRKKMIMLVLFATGAFGAALSGGEGGLSSILPFLLLT